MTQRLHSLLGSRPFAIAMALLICLLTVSLGEMFLDSQKRKAENARQIAMLSQAATLRARIERELNDLLCLSSGLASYLIVRHSSIQGDEIQNILAVLHQKSRHVRNFGVAIGYRLTYVYPLRGNEKAIGLNYDQHPEQWPLIQKIIAEARPALAGPVELVQGGLGLIYRVPIFIDNEYWGLISTVIDSDSLFAAILESSSRHLYDYAVRGRNGTGLAGDIVMGDPAIFDRSGVIIQEIAIPGGHWAIAVAGHKENFPLATMFAIRLTGGLLGGLIGWMLYGLLRSRSALARLVMFDNLTGLPNRRLLEDRAQMAFARQDRHGENLCAVLFLDLDGFKTINDRHGHRAGDKVLRTTARRACDCVRARDTVARWGGDEFIVLLEDVSRGELERLKIRLRDRIEAPIKLDGSQVVVGVSIGQAIYPDDGTELDDMLRIADHGMYDDKSRRKTGL